MEEKVGKVLLNLDYYCGRDLYSDGEVEDKLLQIVRDNPPESYQDIIMQEKSWPVLYHLSNIRENIIDWYPFEKDKTILEVGSGCGAISGALARKCSSLTAIELSKKRSMINAYRHRDLDNLEIMVGNFETVSTKLDRKFDYITLIGVFEYAESYINKKDSYSAFLNDINELLNENGKIIIAIENRLGLKYFAGCREDHVGKFFEGVEGYSNTSGVKTFSRNELISLFEENGYSNYEFYYPYPDYKLPNAIYSDFNLPKTGDLINNLRNFDNDRIVLFDESKAFDGIIESDMFKDFSNSFLIVLEKKVG